MSYSIDVNVLLFASNSESPLQTRALEFLNTCAAGDELLCLTWPTLLGYVRMATHGRIFARPLAHDVALSNVDGLVSLPHARVITELDGFWDMYREVTRGLTVRGKLVPDAHLVALLRQNGVRRLYTNDRDFLKFEGIEPIDPFG
jgi:hypothetical protein